MTHPWEDPNLMPLELDVEAAARSREKTLALLDSIELTPAQQKMAEAVAQYLKRKMTEEGGVTKQFVQGWADS
jgi:hypothetical protein